MRNKPEDQGAGLLKPMREFFLRFAGFEHPVMALKQKEALYNLMTLFFLGGPNWSAN
jgi:hypothetical protein